MPHSLFSIMIESKNNGLRQYISVWRGDIRERTFRLRLRDTITNKEYLFAELEDLTPNRLAIMLSPTLEEWSSLTDGEYEYKIENNAGTREYKRGLLKYTTKEKIAEYEQETDYKEYTPEGW